MSYYAEVFFLLKGKEFYEIDKQYINDESVKGILNQAKELIKDLDLQYCHVRVYHYSLTAIPQSQYTYLPYRKKFLLSKRLSGMNGKRVSKIPAYKWSTDIQKW